MHILVTADTIGGVWTYTRELVTGLVRRGMRVTLVSFGDIPSGAKTQWLEDLPEVDFRPTAFKLEWMQDSASDLQDSAAYLLSLIEDVHPDLLHLSQFCYGALDCDVPRVVVAHSDVLSWWTAVHKQAATYNDWISQYRNVVVRGVAGATTVFAPT